MENKKTQNQEGRLPLPGLNAATPRGVALRLHIISSIKTIIDKEMAYLDPDFKITDLSAQAGVNRTYLSRYFNSELNTSFLDYVNSLRVRKAARLILSGRPLSLESICERSGFSSGASYYRNFKKFTGMTPLEYRKANA